jgi:hypothetical protein
VFLSDYARSTAAPSSAHNMMAEEVARLSSTHRAEWNRHQAEVDPPPEYIREEETYVGTHPRANLELLSRNRLIDIILEFDCRRVGNRIRMETIRQNRQQTGPGVPLRYRRWTPQANSITRRTLNRLRAEVEILQLRLHAEQDARERLERANSMWLSTPPYRHFESGETIQPNLRLLRPVSWEDFRLRTYDEQHDAYCDVQALAHALWVHNQDLHARLIGGYGPPNEINRPLQFAFMRRLESALEPPGRIAENTRTPNEWQYVADRTYLIRQLNHVRRLLGDVVGEFAGHLSSPEQNRLSTRAAEITRSQGRQIAELLESNLQAFVTMSFLHSDHRQMQRQLHEARERWDEMLVQRDREYRSSNDVGVSNGRNVRRRLD